MNEALFLGAYTTEPVFTMLDLGPYPGVIRGGITAIVGEVYAINSDLLRRLDRLENCPRTYYRISLSTPFGNAWFYLYRAARGKQAAVASGDWLHRR